MAKTSIEKKKINFTLAAHQCSRGTQFFPIPCTAPSPHLPEILLQGRSMVASQEYAKVTMWPWYKGLHFVCVTKSLKDL